MRDVGRFGSPASITEKERMSKREVGGTRKYTWSIPVGMYKEIKYIAEREGLTFPGAIQKLCRTGIQQWRNLSVIKENVEE